VKKKPVNDAGGFRSRPKIPNLKAFPVDFAASKIADRGRDQNVAAFYERTPG
jgi:hypothetical protein